jgi:phenylacetate-CoA ligase
MLFQSPISAIDSIQFPAIPNEHASLQLALQYQLEQSQWWPTNILESFQYSQFKILLDHSYQTVPYYRALFDSHSINLQNIRQLDDIKQLPISKRIDIQKNSENILSNAPPAQHGKLSYSTTSGSTGRPVRFARNSITQLLSLAFAMRDHLSHERNFQAKLAAIRWYPRGTAEPPEGVVHPNWGNIVAPIFATGASASLNVVATLQEQINWLNTTQPEYLLSFPSNLIALTEYAQSNNISMPAVVEIRTIGETLTSQARKTLAQYWQTKITDIYTCEEAGYLAIQCPKADHYHVQAENVILEIVDDHDQPCPIGKSGRVLITSLNNFATPLIRYEIGDYAEFGEPCTCGRGLPVIKRILGRKRNRLALPSGDTIFPYLGEHGEIAKVSGVIVHQFQCIQHSLYDVELKLVMTRPLDNEAQSKVAKLMQQHLGYPFTIHFSFPNEIQRGPTGKFEEFISHVMR